MIFKTRDDEEVDIQSCDACKCLIGKGEEYKVTFSVGFDRFFCRKCRPKYKRVDNMMSERPRYFGEIEMTKDGEPVGYKKIEDKKQDESK